jgi:dynein heavy chain
LCIWASGLPQTHTLIPLRFLSYSLLLIFKEYQHCFHKTKHYLKQNPSEKQFEFSEMYIFGKFETFHRRLAKIMDIFSTFKIYAVLQDSNIEGLEDAVTKYQVLFATIAHN